jgi:hypothetical protein
VREQAGVNIAKAQERQARQYNARHNARRQIVTAAEVFLCQDKKGKLLQRRKGPYTVVSVSEGGVCVLRNKLSAKLLRNINVSRLGVR